MLFCTTCCAQCLDYAKVRVVVITFVVECVELLQQIMCRAGRDGLYAKAILFHLEHHKFSTARVTSQEVYEGTTCIRRPIHKILDGATTVCTMEQSKCDVCKQGPTGMFCWIGEF